MNCGLGYKPSPAQGPKEIQGQTENQKIIDSVRRENPDLVNANFEKKLKKISFWRVKKN